jgi:hypothetical protein
VWITQNRRQQEGAGAARGAHSPPNEGARAVGGASRNCRFDIEKHLSVIGNAPAMEGVSHYAADQQPALVNELLLDHLVSHPV